MASNRTSRLARRRWPGLPLHSTECLCGDIKISRVPMFVCPQDVKIDHRSWQLVVSGPLAVPIAEFRLYFTLQRGSLCLWTPPPGTFIPRSLHWPFPLYETEAISVHKMALSCVSESSYMQSQPILCFVLSTWVLLWSHLNWLLVADHPRRCCCRWSINSSLLTLFNVDDDEPAWWHWLTNFKRSGYLTKWDFSMEFDMLNTIM